MSEFLASNARQCRLLRTIVQGVLGVVIANLDLIMGWCVLDPSMRGLDLHGHRRDGAGGDPGGTTATARSANVDLGLTTRSCSDA